MDPLPEPTPEPKLRTPRILVIRRDNIGDLVCTLPLFARLRAAFPEAWIGALVTRYNAEVLHAHPDLDAVFTYQKLKHRVAGESAPGLLFERLCQLWRLRRMGLDLAILAAEGRQDSARRMARAAGARRIVSLDQLPPAADGLHECERVDRVLGLLGLPALPEGPPPAPHIVPRPELVESLRARIPALQGAHGANGANGGRGARSVIGLHLSARKPSQRWPVESFAALVRQLHAADPQRHFLVFWAPGAGDNPLHPGDDDKAAQLIAACASLPVTACPTRTLAELIAGLSLVDALVCSDGGHMHLAAALGKPMVCLFGRSEAARWHPWGVPYRLLQPQSLDVAALDVDEVAQAFGELPASAGQGSMVGVPAPASTVG